MDAAHPRLAAAFATAMDSLGPFEPSPTLAVAVSGGADSMALAILTRSWVAPRGGSALALVVDHGLRPASAAEARITIDRLTRHDVPARLLRLENLPQGPALAERARIMRYKALAAACQEAAILHLLLGHHVADQAETVAMRVLRGSQTHGLAGMSAIRETSQLRLLRPLLGIEPSVLRGLLIAIGLDWVEDPSNMDVRAMRPRLRRRLARHTLADTGLPQAIEAAARLRAREENDIAIELANRATIRPEGFALLSRGRISPAAFSRLVRTIGGLSYPPSPDPVASLSAHPRPATIAGVRIMHAGRLGDGLLILREEAAIMRSVELTPDTMWDDRFRIIGCRETAATVGKLGDDAARFRGWSDLPSAVLRTLPAVRSGDTPIAVPHLGYGCDTAARVVFSPPEPIAGASFVPARRAVGIQCPAPEVRPNMQRVLGTGGPLETNCQRHQFRDGPL